MEFNFAEEIRIIIETAPNSIKTLLEISPWLGGAIVIGLLIRFSIVPLIRSIKGR